MVDLWGALLKSSSKNTSGWHVCRCGISWDTHHVFEVSWGRFRRFFPIP